MVAFAIQQLENHAFFANYGYYPRFGFEFITFRNRFAAKNVKKTRFKNEDCT
jgi:hypothetical protein